MQTLILLIEYDGANYAGWQIQTNATTIQGCIEKALEGISGSRIGVIGAGRTDSGVHARGQVAHAKLNRAFPVREEKIRKALNANLPGDIRIKAAKLTDSGFHARYDAIAREYIYGAISKESVFLTHFAAYFKYPFSPAILAESAKIFAGRRDFTTFSKLNPKTKSYVCNVEICRWEKIEKNYWQLRIKADRFVYGMVRSLVGAIYDAARGKRTIEELKEALKKKDRSLSSPLAPPHGLVLEKIYYPEELDFFR